MTGNSSEAVIFGRVKIKYNGQQVSTNRAFLFFNSKLSARRRVFLDDTGIFLIKLPAGSNHIARIGVKPSSRSEHAIPHPLKGNRTIFKLTN